MTRNQKRCMLASAAIHALLLLILVVGPAFLSAKPKPVPRTKIHMVNATLVDNLLSQAAASQAAPQPQPTPQPPKPEPVREQPKPTPKEPPKEKPVEKPKETPKPKPEPEPRQTEAPKAQPTPKPKPKPTQLPLKPISRQEANNRYRPARPTPQPDPQPDLSKVAEALKDIRSDITPSDRTRIQTTGASAVAMQNYFDYVLGVYDREWRINSDFDGQNGIAKARIVIRRNGSVADAKLTNSSGDPKVDATVEAVLRRVTRLRPFPDGATDSERVYIINFNLQGKVY